jgi:hypothetical protein
MEIDQSLYQMVRHSLVYPSGSEIEKNGELVAIVAKFV